MSLDAIGAALGIYAGTFVVCFLAGLVPLINAELWLFAVTLMVSSPAALPLVVVLAAAGQMAAKVVLYLAARGAIEMPQGRFRKRLDAARARVHRWRAKPTAILWASAIFGLPPFYVISVLAGVLQVRLRTFILIGLVGRTVRFAALMWVFWYGWPW